MDHFTEKQPVIADDGSVVTLQAESLTYTAAFTFERLDGAAMTELEARRIASNAFQCLAVRAHWS